MVLFKTDIALFIPCDYTRIINFCQKESGGDTASGASRRTASGASRRTASGASRRTASGASRRTASGASRRTAGEASRLNPFFVPLRFIFFSLTAKI
ncbi:hypothetical protein [Treponema denticola]|uniref:hypothetical protein n=1 Tax=Treponema denticola TaxID=158 RepID=UPI0020A35BC1|nr:hypothetical protein [Treponema denticola]